MRDPTSKQRKRRSRPCSVCRRWFRPDPRVGARQKTCGRQACVRARHRQMDRLWHARHPDYDRALRLRRKVIEAEEAGRMSPGPRAGPLAGMPWDLVERFLGAGSAVIVSEVGRLCVCFAQEEMR